ncbi:FtsH protease activity modulator HflK [Roseateles puraquae]|uniref:Protein HflK n=1 Tax=Roseateles puraquae TaxID=431059 RepID=A0A254NHH4_9BURK|nr:FtsH protease activity modulator HflK [Roseateles puraquae]MDG0856078.1 FtsH protease activity modulator HflK [Roseateles puraquae]OWR05627.1 FtsH protease activity modulator HflK [Roseateles puraquae]
MSSTPHPQPRSPWAQRLLTPVARAAGRLLNNGRNDGPPDLDELWRDFNRKLSGMFGGKPSGPSNPGSGGGGSPDMKGAGIGIGLIAGVVVLGWLASGFFIVQEGQQGVITSFGKYSKTVEAGFQWRLPYPFQAHEVQPVSQLRQVEVGRSSIVSATGLRDSSMLTQDENIVDIRFTVQFTIRDLRDFLFENRDPEQAVLLAAESAVREIVGKNTMDSVLYEQRDAIAADLIKSIQAQLDRLKAGIQIKNVNVQSVQPPEQVQAAFEDAFKANANREQLKNEAQAYANDVIPRARGDSARLREQAEGYKARVIATAEGDAQRFKAVLAEYQKAPQVTRDRLYTDAMQQVFSNVSKVMVDTKSGSNMLYLPLDKLLQQNSSVTVSPPQAATTTVPEPQTLPAAADPRSRDNQRSRDGR